MVRRLLSSAVIVGLLLTSTSASAQTGNLVVTVREGDGAFNNIRKRLGRDITVEVRDEAGQPVAGADVVFTAPEIGPSVSFGKSATYRTRTDASGAAATQGLIPNTTEGRFNIRISAESQGRTGVATLAQTNTTAGGVGEISSGGSGKKKLLFALLGGAAAGGVIFATKGSGGSSGSPGPGGPPASVPISISVGTVTVGGPR